MTTLREILAMPERENAEGWVIWIDPFTAVKLKYETYVELHRIVTGLSKKEIWRQLRAGTYASLIERIPDEWFDWAESIADELRTRFTLRMVTAQIYHDQVASLQSVTGEAYSRRDQALYIQKNFKQMYAGLVFSLLDGRDISDAIWRQLEPRGDE